MKEHDIPEIPKIDYMILPFIMVFAFYIVLLPHQNFPYPVHIDEWVHLAYSNAVLKASSITFIDPFLGERTIGLSANLEAAYHLFWSVFHQISGISWITIIRYSPAIIFIITVLSVYVLAQREGFGWEAAFFTCLIPTTVGILGPGFFVPIALGLLFIPLSIFLVFNFRTVWSYLVLFIFTAFLVAIHVPTAIGLVLILITYILLNLKDNFKHSLLTGIALAIPFLAPFPWIFSKLAPTAGLLFSLKPFPEYIQLPLIIKTYGYLPVALCLLGTFLLAIRGGKRGYGLVFGLLVLLVMLATFYTFHYGVSVMYERGLMYMMLAMSIVAGAGLMGVKNFTLPLEVPFISQHIGKILCVVLIGVILFMGIPTRHDIPYYFMIDKADYETFVWVRENVDGRYQKAILDPWKATPFAAITEKYVYTRTHSYPTAKDKQAYGFLDGGCEDTAFMKENGISIIYTTGKCDNPDLVEVRENIYLLKEDKGNK